MFNEALLIEQLHIPVDHKMVFFDFFEAEGISATLLATDQRFILLDRLVIESPLFLKMVNEAEIYKD